MTSGLAVRLRQVSQAASMMSSKVSKTAFDSQLPRRYDTVSGRLTRRMGIPEEESG
jgi:hypothetical protein